jgi:CBS domain-containing protein
MNVGQICQRKVVTVRPMDELTAAAQLMREQHVGYLVVVDPSAEDGSTKPVGVLTDRDIVVATVARGVDPRALRVDDVMTRAPVVAVALESIEATLVKMHKTGVRRVPVTSANGELFGVLSIDDALTSLSVELQNIAGAINRSRLIEGVMRP